MRAVRWHARDDVRLDDVPVPVPGDGEVLVRVEAAAVCGTDVDEVRLGPVTVPIEVHPVSGRRAPITLGHEIVGVVAATEAGSPLPVGTRVAPWPSRPCGRCRECLGGDENRCPDTVALGMSADGGMADFLVADSGRCVPLDADVAVERAVLVEPYAVALRALRRVPVAGRRVAVVGLGSLGVCVVESAVRAGAAEVVAVSRTASAFQVARQAGAAGSVRAEDGTDVDAAIVFETAGAPEAIATSIRAARRGGTVVVLGGHVRPLPVDLLDVTVREVALVGSVSHTFADFREAARAIGAGELARVDRPIELAPLEAGPALLRAEGSAAKRILVPSLG
ncbi:MAG TPA: alcohol dehydrogenase catalytic domain-containing protein [Candidatus Limnocylindrales bacterium]|nr:alcohol dehydrogenase catalytic domain-containing protein [Candidatus Limnocylindrales bacterium]